MKKTISVYLMGGLGNQLFQYAFIKNLSLKYKTNIIIDKSGITNKTHNIYQLDKYNIHFNEIKFEDNSLKKKIGLLLFKIYNKLPQFFKIIYTKIIRIFFLFGIYCIPNEYIKNIKLHTKRCFFVGYFQSPKYIDENNLKIIQKELEFINKDEKLDEIVKKISTTESVAIHIRRGDYVGSNFEVCNVDYYQKAIEIIDNKCSNPEFFVFSDDINWVKNNINFSKKKVNYISGNSANEDIYLMSKCKNYIISNSSFSYWGQFLCDNKNKIVIAPSIWFRNKRKIDIYDDRWIKVNISIM